MDPYVFEKLVVLEMAVSISRERGNCCWIGFLYGGGELDRYFRPYAEINSSCIKYSTCKTFLKRGNYRIYVFRICKDFFNKSSKEEWTIKDKGFE